jgi:xylulokinase
MSGDFVLGIDVGTESSRAAIFARDGTLVADASTTYPLDCPRPGWAQQDPLTWWESTIVNIRAALQKFARGAGAIAAVGVCGQMHATIPIGANGDLLSHAVQLWCDKRNVSQCDRAGRRLDQADLLQHTGNVVCPAWVAFKIQWMQENQPEVYAAAQKIIGCASYINLQLTGAIATDLSEASGTLLLDAARENWHPELAGVLGIDLGKLPEITPSATLIGRVTPDSARLTGLRAGTPVVAGGGDMPCLLFGAGLTGEGRAVDITGTAADISVYCREPVRDPRLMNLHHVLPGWFAFGILDSGGGSLRWFRDVLCQPLAARASERGVSVYDLMSEEAEAVPPGAEGLIFLPYLLGERVLGSPRARGTFFGLTPRHTRAHFVRAIVEGVNFDLRQSLDIIRGHRIEVTQIRVIGGGARGRLWRQSKADIYNATTVSLEQSEGGALGAAMLAGIGAGIYRDAQDAAQQVVRTAECLEPRPEACAVYERLYPVFVRLHHLLLPLYDDLADALEPGIKPSPISKEGAA